MIIIAWITAILAAPIHACLQLRSPNNSMSFRWLAQCSIAIAACVAAVFGIGGLVSSGWTGLAVGAVFFIPLSTGLLAGCVIGRPVGWAVAAIIHRI
jgi:hypothetical protein